MKGKRRKLFFWICRLIENNELEKAYSKTNHKLLKWYDKVGLRSWIKIIEEIKLIKKEDE